MEANRQTSRVEETGERSNAKVVAVAVHVPGDEVVGNPLEQKVEGGSCLAGEGVEDA